MIVPTQVSTYTYVFLENVPFSTKTFLILLMSAIFAKTQHFFGKNRIFAHSNSVKAV